ncbi:MAG: hypothetical protein AB1629_05725 [Candidatus Omnitrophota bacterium]
MKKILLLTILSLVVASIGYCETKPLQLSIKSDKKAYRVGETIKLSMFIKNSSDKDVWTPRSFISYTDNYRSIRSGLKIIVKDREGNSLEFLGGYFKSSEGGLTLKPGETLKAFEINLLDWFNINKADTYSIHILSKTEYSGFTNAISNTIQIDVKEKKDISKEEAIKLGNDYMQRRYGKNFTSEYITKPSHIGETEDKWVIAYDEKEPKTRPSGVALRVNKETGEVQEVPLY